MKAISLRARLTALSVLLLALCCMGLTLALNFSAYDMAGEIGAAVLQPALPGSGGTIPPAPEQVEPIFSTTPSIPAQQAWTAFSKTSLLYMLLIIAAGGGLTYVLVGRALEPLKRLSEHMKTCTAGDLSQQLPVPQPRDEIAELTDAFNQMTGKLDQSFAMQRRFAQSAAHELRTPLTVLRTKLEVFQKRTGRSREEYDRLLETVAAQTGRLSDLVRELLELTNLDREMEREPVALLGLLEQVRAELIPLAEEHQIELTVEGEEQTVTGNRTLLARVFFNLLENAVKYNRPGGSVHVALSPGGVVTVSDTGPGVPEELRELIFEPFYRVDKSRSRQMGGAGLGLSTVKAIMERHSGSIEVDEAPEGGCRFTVRLS